MDQSFWAQRVYALGAGAQPLPRKKITVERLAEAIARTVNDKEMKRQASALAKQIHAENGTAKAVELITRCLSIR